jgi:lipoprotein-anchoring transpeptidase ErfK/SrfK
MRARTGIAAAVLAGAAGVAGCGGLADPAAGGGGWPPDGPIRIVPQDHAKGVPVTAPLEVSVPGGRLERVRVVKAADGRKRPVEGRISVDGLRWRPKAQRLGLAARYTVDAIAIDGHGRRSARHTSFTTEVPEHRFIGFFTPEHRSTVGTGMIVSFDFTRPVIDRAAVERGVRVTAQPPVETAPHWFGDDRLDFRPRHYWKPGTRVTVRLRWRGVRAAPGVYGTQAKTIRFTVGRSQTSTVDVAAHTLRVTRDGRHLATVPVTAGEPASATYRGTMVVTARHEVTRMNGDTVGFGGEYDIPDVPHAMRLTASGTFVHGNYWAPPGTFGSVNTSHGCIGLRDVRGGGAATPAGWFFARSLVGDVVRVVGGDGPVVAPDNGLGGWNMPWKQWRAGSALD